MTKKKLLLMVPMLHQGGFEKVCVQTARLLEPYFEVSILIFSSKDINYDITGLDVIDIDVPSKRGLVNKIQNVFKRVKKVREIKKERGIDITYSFGSSANYVNVFSREGDVILTGLRCSTDMEETAAVKLFCRKSDRVLSCSKEIMRELSADFGYDKSSYIYNPLDTDKIKEKALEEIGDFPFNCGSHADKPMDGPIIAAMARDDYIKGLWHLIKAFSIVVTSHPSAKLIILGAGSYKGCKKLCEDLGITDSVAFPGVRQNPYPYIMKSDLYVLSSNHEGFPNALLEAMAMGKPVIAADCHTGPREILLSDNEYSEVLSKYPNGESVSEVIDGSYGILIPDMSQEEDYHAKTITEDEITLATQIIRIVDNPEKMAEYEKAGAEHVKQYEPSKYAADLAEIISDIAGMKESE